MNPGKMFRVESFGYRFLTLKRYMKTTKTNSSQPAVKNQVSGVAESGITASGGCRAPSRLPQRAAELHQESQAPRKLF